MPGDLRSRTVTIFLAWQSVLDADWRLYKRLTPVLLRTKKYYICVIAAPQLLPEFWGSYLL